MKDSTVIPLSAVPSWGLSEGVRASCRWPLWGGCDSVTYPRSRSWPGAKTAPALDLSISVLYQGLPGLTCFCVSEDRKGSQRNDLAHLAPSSSPVQTLQTAGDLGLSP